MDDYNFTTTDGWEYGTGKTEPPKSHGGLIALLLILVIFLTGIVTVLGILNIRLSRQLSNSREEAELAMSFIREQETAPAEDLQQGEPAVQSLEPDQGSFDLTLDETPQQPASQSGESLTLQEIYKQNIPSVVSIRSDYYGGSATGTGVILSADGYIVTNAHVVEEAVELTVLLWDDREYPAQLVGQDPVTDLAVIHIEGEDLVPARFGSSENLQVGDMVVAIGDPLGVELRGTMTDGIISAINRNVELEGRTMSLIQTNAALNSGNSGGPLINSYGQVIGINTMKVGDRMDMDGVEGLGFAIPSATVKDIVDQLIEQGYVSGRPTLGLTGETLSRSFRSYYRLPAGLYVTEIQPQSPAEQCGMELGDILVEVDGQSIDSMDTLNSLLYALDVGDTVTITVYRSGRLATAEVTLAEAMG